MPACPPGVHALCIPSTTQALSHCNSLESLAVTLDGVRLLALPTQLATLPVLHSLELRSDLQVRAHR